MGTPVSCGTVAGTPRWAAGDGAVPAGAVLLDVAATSLPAIAHVVIDQMVYEGQIKPQDQEDILRTLLLQHKYGRGWWSHGGGTPQYLGWIWLQRVPLEPGTGWKTPSVLRVCPPARFRGPCTPPGLGL